MTVTATRPKLLKTLKGFPKPLAKYLAEEHGVRSVLDLAPHVDEASVTANAHAPHGPIREALVRLYAKEVFLPDGDFDDFSKGDDPLTGAVNAIVSALHPDWQEQPVALTPTINLQNRDCIAGMADMEPCSVDLVVTSIPFEELFTYSGKPEDVGNNGSTIDIRAGRFALNMRFVVDAALRVLKPGTNFCCHIQQLLAYKIQHGFMGRRDFRGAMVEVFGAGGFNFVGEFVIPKNPQQAAQRLNLHSLQFKTGYARNGCMLAPFVNDYVLIFQKPGQHPCPPRPLFHKTQNPTGWVTTEEWVRDASGIWNDINEIDVLDGARGHKEDSHEKHVCPLQLEVIRRCVRLYTNPVGIQPDVTVLDPFMGIGSTAYVCAGGVSPMTKLALEEPRNAVGFELKDSYYRASLDYVGKAMKAAITPKAATLFDAA